MKKRKKYFWITAVIITVITNVSILISCSSHDFECDNATESNSTKRIQSVESNEYNKLIDSLTAYTANFVNDHNFGQTRKWGWSKFWESVRADYYGFYNWSECISIGASRKHWNNLCEQEQLQVLDDYMTSGSQQRIIQNKVDSLKNVYLLNPINIGALHNAVILESFLLDHSQCMSTEEIVMSIDRARQYLQLDLPYIDIESTTEELDNFFEEIFDPNDSIVYERLIQKYPTNADNYSILKHYITNAGRMSSLEIVESYTDGYMETINQSNISPESIQKLNSSISIAPASLDLWEYISTLYTVAN